MVSRKGKAIIGLFVLGAIALVCVAVVVLGSGSYSVQKTSFVLYFNSTLRGLTVGSSVYYNGVRVGKVTSLEISTASNQVSFNTPVIIELEEPKRIALTEKNSLDFVEHLSNQNTVNKLIENGLRAKLSTLSFITGLLVIDLAMIDNAEPVDLNNLKPYQGIPQLPTISSGLDSVISEFSSLPLQHLADNLVEVLDRLNKILNEVESEKLVTKVAASVEGIGNATTEFSSLAKAINGNLEEVFKGIDTSFNELSQTMQSVDRLLAKSNLTLQYINETVQKGSSILDENSPIIQQLVLTLTSIQGAANGVNSLTQILSRNPEALFFGKGGR